MGSLRQGHFIMKGYTPELINTYYCASCHENAKDHQVIDIPGPLTDRRSQWGAGLPTTKRHCTGCGAEDGPWISAEIVGGGW